MPSKAATTAKPAQKPSTKGVKPIPPSDEDPVKTFASHVNTITCITMFPDGEKIATASYDKTIRVWRLEDGAEVMKWEVEKDVGALVILRNKNHVVSAEGEYSPDIDTTERWQLWVRDAETARVVAGPLNGHTHLVETLDISPNGGILASGSFNGTVILWDTSTWQMQGDPLPCGAWLNWVNCVQFSPTGHLAVATKEEIQIWDLDKRECIDAFEGHSDFDNEWNMHLVWTPDGTRLLSAGNEEDVVIRSWDTSTWEEAGDPWTGRHDKEEQPFTGHIALNPAGTLLASASGDRIVRLWQLHTVTEVARFKHSDQVYDLVFSVDGRFLFSGGLDKKISQWEIPESLLTDSLAKEKNEVGLPRVKQQSRKLLFDSEIPGQRRNNFVNYERLDRSRAQAYHSGLPRAHVEGSSSSRLHNFNTFFGVLPSSEKKGKEKERLPKRKAAESVDVSLGQATYGDAVGVDDGTRPYALFFCLSWFQKKKKPDLPPPVYDVDLMNDELDIPIPTTRVPFVQQEIELKSMHSQSQPEARSSRTAATGEPLTTHS